MRNSTFAFVMLALQATISAATHPLDPLSASEITATTAVLRAAGKVSGQTRLPILTLHEPPKAEVRAFTPGKPFRREAFAMVFERASGKTFEAIVDLTGRRLLSWTERPGVQAPIMIEDMVLADEILNRDPAYRAAMRKRGVTDLSQVEVDGWSAGYHGLPEDREGHRLVRSVPCYRGTAKVGFNRPIEGLTALVDLTARRAYVTDTGVLPIPPEDPRLRTPPTSSLPPLNIEQPKGTGFTLQGQEVAWANWRFRFAMHPREGLVLYDLGFVDQGRLRPILYRGALSDMVVPYGDPSTGWFFRNVFDTGEYNFVGRSLLPLQKGVDVPNNATLYDATFAGESGKPFASPRAAALYVRDGGLLWRFANMREERAEARRGQELVLAWIITAGNYEYGFNWVFKEDGRIEMEVLLTGIMTTKGVTASHDGMHTGHRVTPELEAVHHQHFFNFRLDMDVDGAANSVVELNTTAAAIGKADPYGKGMHMTETTFHTEADGQRMLNFAAGRKWKVVNPAHKNAVGEAAGYMLIPGENSLPMAAPESWIRKRAGFINRHVWVTPFDPIEMNAGGEYPNQSLPGMGLPQWTARNRSIENTDVVLWYTLGVTHIPRVEEWPVMSAHRAGFQLVPAGFFSRNPVFEINQ